VPRTVVDVGEFLWLPAFARRIAESARVPIDVPGIADVLITEAPKQENEHRPYEDISDHRADEIKKQESAENDDQLVVVLIQKRKATQIIENVLHKTDETIETIVHDERPLVYDPTSNWNDGLQEKFGERVLVRRQEKAWRG
jgi:hypothetical protein